MKKVLKRSFVVFCLALVMLLEAPFHIAYADEYESVTITTSNIVGVSTYSSTTESATFICYLDGNYYGSLTLQINCISNSGQSIHGQVAFYFNGSSYSISGSQLNASRVTGVRSIDYQNLKKMKDTSIPNYYGLDYRDIVGYNYWGLYNMQYDSTLSPVSGLSSSSFKSYSAFAQTKTDPFIRMIDEPLYIALFSNKNNTDVSVIPYYAPNTNCTVTVERIIRDIYTDYAIGKLGFSLLKITVNKPSADYTLNTSNDRFLLNWSAMAGQNVILIPIFYGTMSAMSDDMIRFLGLDESVQSAADLQNEQSEFGQSASELYTYENDFNESLNDSLDDINVNFDIGNTFGSKFLASASWVRQQFDALTSTSPFGSVLSFSLVLGIALLVIGKAVK